MSLDSFFGFSNYYSRRKGYKKITNNKINKFSYFIDGFKSQKYKIEKHEQII